MITTILASNYITLSFILGLSILILTNSYFNKKYNLLFIAYIIIVLLLDIADMIDYAYSSATVMSLTKFYASAFGYTLRTASLAIILNILFRNKKFSILVWVPVIIIGLIAFTSNKTHLMFWFDCRNNFMRGPLSYISHIVSAVYLVILLVITILYHKNLDHGEIITVVFIVISSFIAMCIETIYSYRFILPGVMISSCALYYIVLYIQSYKTDTLTGALKRRCLFTDCEKWHAHSYVIVSIDLNGLKEVNDKFGHKAGDEAICTLVETLTEVAGKDYRIYRNGGDEFIAVGRQRNEMQARTFIEKCRVALGRTKFMASFGYAVHHPYDVLDDVLVKADVKMYKDKSRYHKNLRSEILVQSDRDED